MNELVMRSENELPSLSVGELRAELVRALEISAASLAYLAAVYRELVRRGEDLSDLRSGLAVHLPAIADGKLAPEAAVRFAGRAMLLRCVATLPLAEQRRLADGGVVPVVREGAAGGMERLDLPAHELKSTELRLVFDERGYIHSHDEQEAMLARRRPHTRHRAAPLRIDPASQGKFLVGNARVDRADLVSALVMTADTPEPERAEISIPLALSRAEARALQARAEAAGMGMQAFIRSALALVGAWEGVGD